jgi:hypothetical protein
MKNELRAVPHSTTPGATILEIWYGNGIRRVSSVVWTCQSRAATVRMR